MVLPKNVLRIGKNKEDIDLVCKRNFQDLNRSFKIFQISEHITQRKTNDPLVLIGK